MHELSIANALIDQVCAHAAEAGAERVAEINLRLGVLSGVARALHFCFSSAAQGTACEGAALNIDEIPLTVTCTHCDAVKSPSGLYNFRCPDCGRPTPKVLTGREMQLVSVALVPPAPKASPGRSRRAGETQAEISGSMK
jgi:hydrogenase nickel incorporation protein HypA/HybF